MFVFGGHNAYRGVESYGYSGWKDDEKTFFLSLNPKQPDQQLDQQLDQLPHQQQVPDQLPHLLQNETNDNETNDNETNETWSWSQVENITYKNSHHSANLIGNSIYLFGGLN